MLKGLRTVIYHVRDLQAAKEWYTRATGVAPYFDEPFYVGFDINGFELGLDPDWTAVDEGNQSIAYWSVENTDKAVQHFVDLGAKTVQARTNVGGDIYVAIVKDPFGNCIGLIEGA